MAINLDKKDRKLLYELDSNSRQSCSQIGKKIGLSPEVVNYRIKRLEKENIITQYQVIVNLYKLGIIQFKICLSFQHMNSLNLEENIKTLKQHPAVKWIVSCNGNWDFILSLETDSLQKVDEKKDEILSVFGTKINKKSISLLIEAQTYNRDYLIDDKNLMSDTRIIMQKDLPLKLDDLDLAILKKLSKNARKPIIEIASDLNSTARVITYRIKQLEKKKIILGYKVALNYSKLGLKFFKTFIYLDNPTIQRKKALQSYLLQQKNIIHHVKVLGNWDLEPEFEVSSDQEFDEILTDIKDRFSDIIKSIDVITISKEHKFVYF